MINSIQIPPSLFAGNGSISELSRILEKRKAEKVILITDVGVRSAGLCDALIHILEEHSIKYRIIDSVVSEPSVYDVDKVVKQIAAEKRVDILIAVGGGSTMDTAKIASLLIGANYTIFDLLNDSSLAHKNLPTIMVPTTCGTGAEATCNAIVAIPEEDTKQGIVNHSMIPDDVILDSNMLATLPMSTVAATGVDALAHCVECYIGNKATMLSDTYALAGAALIFNNLEKAYHHPEDEHAKMQLLLGAFYGGVAITGSGTTAVHALAYPLGGRYHIPHGVSNAMLFSAVMTVNRRACEDRLSNLCDVMDPSKIASTEEEKSWYVIDRISQIIKNTNIPTSLKKFGIGDSDLDFLVLSGSQQKRLLSNNPIPINADEIREIYRSIL